VAEEYSDAICHITTRQDVQLHYVHIDDTPDLMRRLASVGITNAREMASLVPGLQIGVQEGNTEVFIRGIGSDNNTEIGDPAVALHIDGVYIPRPRGVGSMFYDIERVEVNSGPQGTVRGRNAMGGAVNIVSKRPKLEEFGADAEATFGTFSQRRYQGMVNIPIGSMLALRAAAFSEVHDSYFINAGPLYDIPAGENANSYAYRLQLLYQPTQRFSALVGYDYTFEGGTGYLGANFQGPLTTTQQVPAPQPGDVVLAVTASHQLNRDVRRVSGAVPTFDAASAVEVGRNADVVDADQFDRVVDVIDKLLHPGPPLD